MASSIKLVPDEDSFREVAEKLESLCDPDYKDCVDLTLKDLYNNAKGKYTPVGKSTATHKGGQLKRSATMDTENHTFGYTAEYAPHVEFGHRICRPAGHQVGYVEGQNYLQRNIEAVRPEFKKRIIKYLQEYGKL